MLKYFVFVLYLFVSSLNADMLDDKIKNLIGDKEYKTHQNLIGLIFQDKNKFIINNKIRYYRVFQELKSNGLLKLKLTKPQDITIEFKVLNKSFKAYKMLNDTMQMIGYNYFLTKTFTKDGDTFNWKIIFKAEYMIDSVIFLKELHRNNCKITDVQRPSTNSLYYQLDFNNAYLNDAIEIEKNEKIKFTKPLRPYMIKVKDAKSLKIVSQKLNKWFPHISFFDKDLKVLNIIKKNRIYRGITIKVPQDTEYIKITDLYNLINIKRGLTIIVR